MHVLPDLERLEKKYEDSLVIVGVHSGKFKTEQQADGLRDAVARFGITHPNVNDPDYEIWKAYGVSAWPTLVVIDPAGKIIDRARGEGHGDELDATIGAAVEAADKKGTLKRGKFETKLAESKAGVLAFPGKIAAGNGLLYIADTGHHRIVVAQPDGKVVDFVEGFKSPQGLCVDGATLYVADTGNHRVCRVEGKTVAALAAARPLRSPWDVVKRGDELFVAMAGTHQIWRFKNGDLDVYAGSGAENIRDGERATARFAQPSGLALIGDTLFVADSEVSGIWSASASTRSWARASSISATRTGAARTPSCSTRSAWPRSTARSTSPTATTTRSSGSIPNRARS
jgi:hypothetical protein